MMKKKNSSRITLCCALVFEQHIIIQIHTTIQVLLLFMHANISQIGTTLVAHTPHTCGKKLLFKFILMAFGKFTYIDIFVLFSIQQLSFLLPVSFRFLSCFSLFLFLSLMFIVTISDFSFHLR